MQPDTSIAAHALRQPRKPVRVLHLIPSLRQGGAEAMLCALVSAAIPDVEHRICTMINEPAFFDLDERLVARGAGVQGRPSPAIVRHIRRCIDDYRPDVVHGWMYHANLASLICLGHGPAIVWSIHNTHLRVGEAKRMTRWVDRVCAILSHVAPARIVYVSEFARSLHEERGYARRKGMIIPNGIDIDRFDPRRAPPDPRISAQNGRAIVGMVARFEPGKGHRFLIDAVASHPRLRESVHLVFVGRGCDGSSLGEHLQRVGLSEHATLLGPEPAIERLYAAFDIVAMPSFGEALPMSVLEAAAMNKPVAASRVGDIPMIGLPEVMLFDPGDAVGCARALEAALAAAAGGSGTRELISQRFSLQEARSAYRALYRDLAGLPLADNQAAAVISGARR